MLRQRNPAGYEEHKTAMSAFYGEESGEGGLKIKEVVEVPYVPDDPSDRSVEELLAYAPKTGAKDSFNFDKAMADVEANANELYNKLTNQDVKYMRGFHPEDADKDSARYKVAKIRGDSAEYDKGGRYLGGGKSLGNNKPRYVDAAGKLQIGRQSVKQLYKEAVGTLSRTTQRDLMRTATGGTGIGRREARKELGIKKGNMSKKYSKGLGIEKGFPLRSSKVQPGKRKTDKQFELKSSSYSPGISTIKKGKK